MSERRLRTLIVDDEAPARELLRFLLGRSPSLEIIGEAADGPTAVDLIAAERPDLVFLDVQMPEMNGFEVVAAASSAHVPIVVFITGYDQFAIRAFEVNACDYLLKPVNEERLRDAVDRAVERHAHGAVALRGAMSSLLRTLHSGSWRQQVVLRTEGRHVFANPDDIVWVEAAGKGAHVHLKRAVVPVPELLSDLERRLDSERFIRVQRSSLVNRSHIQEIQPWFHGDYVVILSNGTRVTTGRRYRDTIRRLLGIP